MQRDYDQIGFWVRNIPYIWVPGKKWEECERWYFLDPFTEVYSEDGKLDSARLWFSSTLGSKEIYELPKTSIINSLCGARTYFYVFPLFEKDERYPWYIENGKIMLKYEWFGYLPFVPIAEKTWEFRINGVKLDYVPKQEKEISTLEIIKPDGKILKLGLPPPEFVQSLENPPLGFHSELASIKDTEEEEEYLNIQELARKKSLNGEEATKIHKSALKKGGRYRYKFLEIKEKEEREKSKNAVIWFFSIWSGTEHYRGPRDADEDIFEYVPFTLEF